MKEALLPNESDYYGTIYCTTNLVNGKKYIGQTRKETCRSNVYIGSGNIIKQAIKKYGRKNFQKDILQYCINENDLSESEVYWIDYFGAQKSDLFYNIAPGGQTSLSVRTPEARKRMSELKKKNFKFHENSRLALEKLSREREGTKSSKETRAKISKSHLGLPMHPNTSKAILDSIKCPIIQLSKTGEFIAEFNYIKEAAESFNLSDKKTHCIRSGISEVAKGNGRNTCNGFKWKYKE